MVLFTHDPPPQASADDGPVVLEAQADRQCERPHIRKDSGNPVDRPRTLLALGYLQSGWSDHRDRPVFGLRRVAVIAVIHLSIGGP